MNPRKFQGNPLGSTYCAPFIPSVGDSNNRGMLLKELRVILEARPCTHRCLLCEWVYEGPLEEGRLAFTEHRATHGQPVKRRRVRCQKHDCHRWASVKAPHGAALCREHLGDAYQRADGRQGGWGIRGHRLTLSKEPNGVA